MSGNRFVRDWVAHDLSDKICTSTEGPGLCTCRLGKANNGLARNVDCKAQPGIEGSDLDPDSVEHTPSRMSGNRFVRNWVAPDLSDKFCTRTAGFDPGTFQRNTSNN
jgi:hypothetical protein